MKGTARKTLVSSLSLPSRLFFFSLPSTSIQHHLAKLPATTFRVFTGFKPLSTTTTSNFTKSKKDQVQQPMKHNPLLERLRMRQLKGAASKTPQTKTPSLDSSITVEKDSEDNKLKKFQEMNEHTKVVSSFEELGLSDEVMAAVKEMGIWGPTEIQCVGIPALLEGKNVVLGSDIESGATLAYLLPIIQVLRRDEAALGIVKPRHPRAVVLCPTMELSEEVLYVAKTIRHHVHIRSAMVSGGDCSSPQHVSSDVPIDLVAGTPSSVLQQIEEGDMAYDDIKYLVLEDVDTMFDSGLGPDICKFLGPLKDDASKADGQGFQMVLVISSITKMISEQLSSLVEQLEHNNSGKVAGILLEMDQTEVFDLALSPDALKKKVAEAMMSLV